MFQETSGFLGPCARLQLRDLYDLIAAGALRLLSAKASWHTKSLAADALHSHGAGLWRRGGRLGLARWPRNVVAGRWRTLRRGGSSGPRR